MGGIHIVVGRCHFCLKYYIEEHLSEVELKKFPRDSRGRVFACDECEKKLRSGLNLCDIIKK